MSNRVIRGLAIHCCRPLMRGSLHPFQPLHQEKP